MAICSSCSCNPCCCPEPHPVPAPPVVSVESHPAALPDCPSCPPVIHEVLESFVIPSIDESVTVDVCTSEAWPVGMCVHITDGNKKAVLKIVSANSSSNTIELRNDGSDQTDPGGTVMSGTVLMLLHGLCPDEEEQKCWVLGLRTAAAFTVPAEGEVAEITLSTCATLKAGQKLYIEGFGCVTVANPLEESPFAVFQAEFYSLFDSLEGDLIAGGAYVTTAESCNIQQAAGEYLGSASTSTFWPATTEETDPEASGAVSIVVVEGQRVRIEGNATMESPRTRLKFNVTGTAGATKTVGRSHIYEDGHGDPGGDPVGPVDTSPYMTAYQMEVWEAQADGTIIAKWETQNAPGVGGTPAVATNITDRTVIIFSA